MTAPLAHLEQIFPQLAVAGYDSRSDPTAFGPMRRNNWMMEIGPVSSATLKISFIEHPRL
jgi:hypothetical protein